MNRSTTTATLLVLLVASPLVDSQDSRPPGNGEVSGYERLKSARLPNAWRLTDKVISGGQPVGDAGFAELRALGVRTIISVDGARPDVAAARKHGLRYVHLPHGYDGIPERRMLELAKAARDLPGPIYIHCHHGKHRSPAAAAAACVAIGALTIGEAEAVLKTAGTSPNYRGLYASVRAARPIDSKSLDALMVEFRETSTIPPLAEAMVEIEHHFDHLQAISAAGWKTLPDHPDRDPPHEALLLAEQFTELLRTDAMQQHSPEFAELVRTGERAAYQLESSLRDTPAKAASHRTAFANIAANCQTCHQRFRDVPIKDQ